MKLNQAASKIQRAFQRWRAHKFAAVVLKMIHREKQEIEKGREELSIALIGLKQETNLYYEQYLKRNEEVTLNYNLF